MSTTRGAFVTTHARSWVQANMVAAFYFTDNICKADSLNVHALFISTFASFQSSFSLHSFNTSLYFFLHQLSEEQRVPASTAVHPIAGEQSARQTFSSIINHLHLTEPNTAASPSLFLNRSHAHCTGNWASVRVDHPASDHISLRRCRAWRVKKVVFFSPEQPWFRSSTATVCTALCSRTDNGLVYFVHFDVPWWFDNMRRRFGSNVYRQRTVKEMKQWR